MSYNRFLTARSLARKPSPIRVFTAIKEAAGPEMISLAAGAPNPKMFPLHNISVTTNKGVTENWVDGSLHKCLQYGTTVGSAPLIKHLETLQTEFHNFKPDQHSIVVTTGSQDGLSKVIDALLDTGDKVILDEAVYSGTLAALRPYNPNIITVKSDHNGMDMTDLSDKLSGPAKGTKFLLTVTNGSNPTGGSLSLERRIKLLNLAEKHDFFVIEDDPYYWLSFEQKLPSLFNLENSKSHDSSTPSGRVLRSDSCSKTISSGIRVGWLTGPKDIIQRIILHQEATTMHTPTLCQNLVTMLFDSWEGNVGFVEHCDNVTNFYKIQCDELIKSCEKHLDGLAVWKKPKAGMFLWVKILGIEDSSKFIQENAQAANILLVPGQCFMADDRKSPYCRLSYSLESPERMDLAVERLAKLIREEKARIE